VARWEEFSYKWPVACELSSILATLVSLKILFFETQGRFMPANPGYTYWWALTRIVFPGLGIVGTVYGCETACGLWFGNVLGLIYICYLIGLWYFFGKRV